LGMGANTAIFQLLDAVRLRSLPVPNPQQLARVQIRNGNRGFGITEDFYQLTYPLWQEIRNHQQPFSSVFAWTSDRFRDTFRIGEGAQARSAPGLLVSGEFFSALEVQPAAGRFFSRDDDRPACAAPGVVLSYAFWQSEFGGRSSAIGSRLVVMDHPLEVIGVAPATFSGLEVGKKFDLALPLCALKVLQSGDTNFERRDYFWLTVMGRLKPGWTIAQASGQLQAISPGLFAATVPTGYAARSLDAYKKFRLEAVPAGNGVSELRGHYDTSLWLLLGITALVLLIACANLANLLLARAGMRQREWAVRLALGASHARIIRQSLCESLLLACAGAGTGLALARILSQTIVRSLSSEGDFLQLDLTLDSHTFAFMAAVAATTCLIVGLVPALRSARLDPGETIKAGGRGLTADRNHFSAQSLLVVVQISISVVLVAGALLFVRSLRNLMTLDPGFRAKGILLVSFDMKRLKLPAAQLKPFDRQLLDEIRSVPLVEAAATTSNVLIGGGMWSLGVNIGSVRDSSRFTWVSPGYLETLQTPLIAGRDFNANDTETSPKVVIVNQTFVHRFFGETNPIGRTFRTSPEPNYPETECQIVGVIKDTRYYDLREPAPPIAFAPASQHPDKGPWTEIYVRSSAPLGTVRASIERRIRAVHPELSMESRTFQEQIEDGLIRERVMAGLSGFFGVLAALLATIGLYGVIAYVVAGRRKEIGIRMALGASRGQVIGLILKEAATLVAIGLGIGVIGLLVFGRTTASLLFGLEPYDPATLAVAASLLAAVALLGSYLPARRASRFDPMAALRYE